VFTEQETLPDPLSSLRTSAEHQRLLSSKAIFSKGRHFPPKTCVHKMAYDSFLKEQPYFQKFFKELDSTFSPEATNEIGTSTFEAPQLKQKEDYFCQEIPIKALDLGVKAEFKASSALSGANRLHKQVKRPPNKCKTSLQCIGEHFGEKKKMANAKNEPSFHNETFGHSHDSNLEIMQTIVQRYKSNLNDQ